MAYETEITLPFADGEYRFWLDLPRAKELETDGPTIFSLAWFLQQSIGLDENGRAFFNGDGEATVHSIRDVIRLGLIAGGRGTADGEEFEVGPQRAKQLVEAYVYPARPLAEGAVLAWRILAAAVYGTGHAIFGSAIRPDEPAVASGQPGADATAGRPRRKNAD